MHVLTVYNKAQICVFDLAMWLGITVKLKFTNFRLLVRQSSIHSLCIMVWCFLNTLLSEFWQLSVCACVIQKLLISQNI